MTAGLGQHVSPQKSKRIQLHEPEQTTSAMESAAREENLRDYCRVLTASPPRLMIGKTGKIAGVLFRH